MGIYFALYGAFAAAWLVLPRMVEDRKKMQQKLCVVCFALLFLLLALRHPSMGVDLGHFRTYGYLASFDEISAMSWQKVLSLPGYQNYEKGFILLIKLVGSIWPNRQFFLAVCAALSIFPVACVVYRRSDDPFFSAIIYVGLPSFVMLFSSLRQNIALGLCLLALYYAEEKKPIRFLLLVLFASLFHKTCLLFLLAYPLFHIRLNRTTRLLTVPVLFVIYLLRYPLFSILSRILSDEAAADGNGAIALLLFFIALYVFCTYYMDEEDPVQNGYLNLFYLTCACQCFGGVYAIALRVGLYFALGMILLIPRIVNRIEDDPTRQAVKTVMLIGFIALGLYNLYVSSWAMATPYYFCWEYVEPPVTPV